MWTFLFLLSCIKFIIKYWFDRKENGFIFKKNMGKQTEVDSCQRRKYCVIAKAKKNCKIYRKKKKIKSNRNRMATKTEKNDRIFCFNSWLRLMKNGFRRKIQQQFICKCCSIGSRRPMLIFFPAFFFYFY